MRDFFRLALFLIMLPIFLGPALVSASLRGQQWLGLLTINMTRYSMWGRIAMFFLGLAVWAGVWSGIGVIIDDFGLYPVRDTWIALVNPVPSPTPTKTPTQSTATAASAPPSTPTQTLTATVPPTQTSLIVSAPVETPSPNPRLTATAPVSETPRIIIATSTLTAPTASPTVTLPVTPTGDITDTDIALDMMYRGNDLLLVALADPSEVNLAGLGSIWQRDALESVRGFVADVNARYTDPFTVELEYLNTPAVQRRSPDTIVITVEERWSYTSAGTTEVDELQFFYTLNRLNNTWIITNYGFLNM